MTRLRLTAILAALGLLSSACVGASGSSERYIDIHFTRAVGIFPGNSVRVLGVDVGRVVDVDVDSERDAAVVRVRIDDPGTVLPAGVRATIVPVQLLGERYVQLHPAYEGGPRFTGSEIPLERTTVPVEQDELLRSLQDYFGELDPDKVEAFVSQSARVLRGNGEELNRLIDAGTEVISTLNDKRDTLAALIQNFEEVTTTLSRRQQAIATLINTYNSVARNLNSNREALEGTIEGLNEAARQLASLLVEHRRPLGEDIRTLTRTARTFARNVHRFARTGHWADRLFSAAERAVDFDRDWLRLGNQGAPLIEMLEFRLRDRLVGVCLRLGIEDCQTPAFWARRLPDLFCLDVSCPSRERRRTPGDRLNEALADLPPSVGQELADGLAGTLGDGRDRGRRQERNCRKARRPRICRLKKQLDPGQTLDELLQELQEDLEKLDDPVEDLTGGLLP